MLLAVVEFGEFAILAGLVVILAGGGVAASAYLRPADRDRLQRVEDKLDLILAHFEIEYVPPPKSAWQELADEGQKIHAIKAYRKQHGAGLAESKTAVEDYIQSHNAKLGEC